MKKQLLLGFITSFTVFVCGCSSQNATAVSDANKLSTESETELMDAASEFAEPVTEFTGSETEITEVPAEPNSFGITIQEQQDSSSFSSEDNSQSLLDVSVSYPKITIANQESATEKINSAINAELNTFWTYQEENASYAKEEYNMSLDDSEYSFEPYTASLSYEMKRCDDKIISLVFTQDEYTGGAHGNHWSYGLTFDTASGEKLTLNTLSDNDSDFYHMLLDDLTRQVSLPAYKDYIFEDFSSDIESVLLQDSAAWYLDRSGMSFISNPYVLGPYAAGTFEFNIPYEQLSGLKKNYAYDGAYVRKLFPGISAQYDINGDQKPDDICYAINFTENMSDFALSLTVNGTDFSKVLKKLDFSYPSTKVYYLLDTDPQDDFVEIAISNEDYENMALTCTYLFRYERNQTLTYLGNMEGLYEEGQEISFPVPKS